MFLLDHHLVYKYNYKITNTHQYQGNRQKINPVNNRELNLRHFL